MDGKRLKFVDGLRGVAAMLVVLFHLVGRTSAAALTSRGYLGVSIFFVLSGFVITAMVGTRRVTPGFLGRFALRRMVRPDIPYWLNIALALVLMGIAVRIGIAKQPVQVWQTAAHLAYLQEILGYPEINTVYWTLCLEVQFYLTLILLLWGAQALHAPWPRFIAVFVALLGFSLLAGMKWISTPAGLMLPYWWAFALGALCYWTLVGRVQARYLAAGCVLADHQESAHAEHGRLQRHAQHLRHRAKATDDVAGAQLAGHVLPVGFCPAMHHAARHSHGDDRFGVAMARLRELAAIRCDDRRARVAAVVITLGIHQYRLACRPGQLGQCLHVATGVRVNCVS